MRQSLTDFLVQFPVVTLFAVIGMGYLIGQIRWFGFRLGVAGVLFAGLAAGALGPQIALPSIVSSVGLILFIYSIGIQFGPGFQNPFRKGGYRDNVFCVAMLLTGAAVALGVAAWQSLSGPTLAGLFSGALTNAPALAAAQEALRGHPSDQTVIAFGIAYPFGVLGVMLGFQLYRTAFGIKPAKAEPAEPIEVRDFIVQNPGIAGQSLAEIRRVHQNLGFIVSRVQRNGQTSLATADTRLALGDVSGGGR